MKSTIRPEFVFIAEKAGRVIGLLFAMPDINQQLRGESVDTLIFKTLAIAALGQHLCTGPIEQPVLRATAVSLAH